MKQKINTSDTRKTSTIKDENLREAIRAFHRVQDYPTAGGPLSQLAYGLEHLCSFIAKNEDIFNDQK